MEGVHHQKEVPLHLCTQEGGDEGMGPLGHDDLSPLTLLASPQSWLPVSLKVRASIPMRSEAVETKFQLVLAQL